MTGNHIYDMFMGAPLNPRIGKYLDLKMFSKLEFLGLFYSSYHLDYVSNNMKLMDT